MLNPRIIKKRVGSIKNIGKMTKALEMVSSSRVQKAINKALKSKPYASLVYELVFRTLSKVEAGFSSPLIKEVDVLRSDLYIVISTNRGLVASLNTNLFRKIELHFSKYQNVKHSFVTVGKKGRLFSVTNGELVADLSDEVFIDRLAATLTRLILDGFLNRIYDRVYLCYTEFINALKQEPIVLQLLPVSKDAIDKKKALSFDLIGSLQDAVSQEHDVYYNFEPDISTVVSGLLPFYIQAQIVRGIYEAQASEHSSRMMAMKNATDNAKELSEDLNLIYNKARQSLITSEISDIATAQISLNYGKNLKGR